MGFLKGFGEFQWPSWNLLMYTNNFCFLCIIQFGLHIQLCVYSEVGGGGCWFPSDWSQPNYSGPN